MKPDVRQTIQASLSEAVRHVRDANQAGEAADAALRRLKALEDPQPAPSPLTRRLTGSMPAPPPPQLRPPLRRDTPVARRFLTALEVAAQAGVALDRERGHVDADGEPIGRSVPLVRLVMEMRAEIFGDYAGSGMAAS